MIQISRKGQGESLIKLLVFAIIAVIALALAKSYFQEAGETTTESVSQVFTPAAPSISAPLSPLYFLIDTSLDRIIPPDGG